MATYTFYLNISTAEMMRYYRGEVYWVHAWSEQGEKIQFPADMLRPFVTPGGIYGRFRMRTTASNKLKDLEQIG